jgi:AAA domain
LSFPGLGKSQVQTQYVARATTGRTWPDGTNGIPAGNVIMLTAEDCLDQIVVPRLDAAKADRRRVHILKCIRKDNKNRMFLLGEDIEPLVKIIANIGDVRLVTLDPINNPHPKMATLAYRITQATVTGDNIPTSCVRWIPQSPVSRQKIT